MEWEECEIEKIAKKIIVKDFGQSKGDYLFSIYSTTKNILIEDVLPEIRGKQPYLTDHGPKHIAKVLNNAHYLLGAATKKLSGAQLYCLMMSILFHDVGNFYDNRKEHQNHISEIYDYVRKGAKPIPQEKLIVVKLVGAHSGKADDGSRDTIQTICDKTHFEGKPVDLGSLAAILRFADELAEGAQRTSFFMHHFNQYPLKNEIYHRYARATEVNIDRGNQRIALTYHIEINTSEDLQLSKDQIDKISELIDFTYDRIVKLDQERQYARYYCEYLSPFMKTTVVFNYWIDGELQDFGLNQLSLSDLVVPGDIQKKVKDYDVSYDKKKIIETIYSALDKKRRMI